MSGFIKMANLPQGKVSSVICGELCSELNDYLDSIGVERIVIEPNIFIDPAVRFHADMAVLHLGGERLIADKNQTCLINSLKERGFTVIETSREIKGEYPKDVALNFAIIGDRIMGNFRYADDALTESLSQIESINVKQGYCKCSCLAVSENAIITDDKSIYDKASEKGIDCLFISKGDISLEGHEYGFIGGASGKISKDEILFFGDITHHCDYKKIAAFIEKHGCRIIRLNFPLTDFGGIIPITEKAP